MNIWKFCLKNHGLFPGIQRNMGLSVHNQIQRTSQFKASFCNSCMMRQQKLSSSTLLLEGKISPLTIFSEEENMMRETVTRFSQEKVAPFVRKMDQDHAIDQSVFLGLFENGLMSIETDPKYGGSGSSFFAAVLAIEELAKVDPTISLTCDLQNTLCNKAFIKFGTEEQKEKYLPRLAAEYVACFCLSEAESGSDAFALKTVAKKDGSNFIINGSKMWISLASLAQVFLVMANADTSLGYKGLTCFIVDKSMPGVTIGKTEDKLGLCASPTCVVHFDNVAVPEENILGDFGQGYKVAIGLLNEGRIGIGAQMLGLSQGCLNATVPYLLQRKQFGSYIFDFQAVQHAVATMASEIESARLLVYNAARLKEVGCPFVKEACMAKLMSTEIACRVTSKCLDLMGGVGFTKDFPIEKFYRDCKAGTIYEGTSNMQLNTIAKILKSEYLS